MWEGNLSEGGTKSFNAPYGQVGYATKKNLDDPWEENQEECYGGAAIEIPCSFWTKNVWIEAAAGP